jgi:2-haloacid dehalogenase
MSRYGAVAFDLYGTVLDVSGLARALEKPLGARAASLLAAWRKAQLERTWALNARGEYEPFDRVTEHALREVAPELPQGIRDEACAAWLSVPAYPDAREMLQALRRAGVRSAILSNGTLAMIRAALAAAQLSPDEVRSVDEVRVYKPDSRVYELLDDLAPRERTLFVSSNGWDAEGCKRTGRSVAWIDRGAPPPAVEPDVRVRSLSELVEIVVGEGK